MERSARCATVTPVPILLYHSITETATAEYEQWCVHPERFDEHLRVVLDLGFTPMAVSEFVDARRKGRLPSRPCLITFDDGRADFARFALPILRQHSLPATMYVVAGHIDGTSAWLPMDAERAQPMMSWSDLRSLGDDGIEVGAHSVSHVELDVVSARRRHREIVGSRSILREGIDAPVRSFAYPYGYHHGRVVADVRAAGFDSACAVHDRWSHGDDDLFALSRLFVWDTTTADDLRRLLTSPPSTPPEHRATALLLRTGWRLTRWARHRGRHLVGAAR